MRELVRRDGSFYHWAERPSGSNLAAAGDLPRAPGASLIILLSSDVARHRLISRKAVNRAKAGRFRK
jgi:hypothetical protein